MIYKTSVNVPSRVKTVEYFLEKCLACGGDDMRVEEYEDQFGFISTVECKECRTEIKENCNLSGIIKSWNSQNNIDQVIKSNYDEIERLKEEIKNLKAIKRKRSKK